MNWRISAATAALVLLPLGTTYAAIANQDSNPQESIIGNNTRTEIAQRGEGGRKGRRGEGLNRILEQLNLTSEQSAQIEAIKENSKASKEALREQMQAEKQEMRSLLQSDASPAALTQQHQKLQALRQQKGDNRFQNMLQIREVLTSEQRAQMVELIGQRKERRGQRSR